MTNPNPFIVEGIASLDATEIRQIVAATFDPYPFTVGVAGIAGNPGWGVVGPNSYKVTGAGTALSVAAGLVVVKGTSDADQLGYVTGDNTATSLSVPTATNQRRDLIVKQVRDSEWAGANDDAPAPFRVAGGDSTSPTDPPVPASCVVLYRARVNNTGVYQLDDLRQRATAQGGETICTSTTRPVSPFLGQRIFETDTLRSYCYDGANWVWTATQAISGALTWTPALTQPSAVSVSVTEGRYIRQGARVEAWATLSATGTGVANQLLLASLPVPAGHASAAIVGNGTIWDSSANVRYSCSLELWTPTAVLFTSDASQNAAWGTNPALAVEPGDAIRYHLSYLAA